MLITLTLDMEYGMMNNLNQHDRKHYYFERQDPFKLGHWEDESIFNKEEILAVVCFILCITVLGCFLFL